MNNEVREIQESEGITSRMFISKRKCTTVGKIFITEKDEGSNLI